MCMHQLSRKAECLSSSGNRNMASAAGTNSSATSSGPTWAGRPNCAESYGRADSSSVANTLRISCRDGVGGLVHQRGEHLVGCRKAECLARPTVEPGGDRVEFGLREHRQVGALGQILA